MQVKFSSLPLHSLDNDGNVPVVRRFAARQRRAFEYHARRGGRIVARFSSMIHINGTCHDVANKEFDVVPVPRRDERKRKKKEREQTLRL